ncbi:uncharacterized protein LOC129590236 isoform X2 [Paramacrobiotus metropolitanus]|nr:uncharacterized protein LOC129590236 isoform X2 [Paramacrobiotus metropolitanus]
MNVDTRFTRWPNRNQILFYLDTNYTVAEQYMIRLAAWRIQNDLSGCVTFVETSATDTRFKLRVTPNAQDGTPEPYCSAYPGMAIGLSSASEQRHVIARGTNGCLDSQRSVMKYWAMSLGRRNEHERGDRDLYLTMNNNNVVLPAAYRLYAPNEAFWGALPYDFCSITHNRLTDFAQPGTAAFIFKTGPQATPVIPQLTNTDCRLITAGYGCDGSFCQSFDCDAARQAALAGTTPIPPPTFPPITPGVTTPSTVTTTRVTTSTPTTTTPTTPTTPTTTATTTPTTTPTTTTRTTTTTTTTTTTVADCPLSTFCNAVPDESSNLLGPFVKPTAYLLFSGSCVMEYTMDWDAGKLNIQSQPEKITTYFPPPGGPGMPGPVTLSYLTNANAETTYTSFFQDQSGSKVMKCVSDQGKKADYFTCANSVTSSGIIPPATATSASTQYTNGDGHMANYVVNGAQNEIKLIDSPDLTQPECETSSGFLNGQNKITKVTGIQIIQDLEGFHNQVLTVFGSGADGKAYVGFYDMPLDGSCNVPLSGTWKAPGPQLLSTAIKGC